MTYVAFEVCTVSDCGQKRRGAKATCGRCNTSNTVAVNYFRRSGGDDHDVIERHVAHKFEALGWKIGKTPAQNRCPGCFSAIKLAAVRKSREAHKMTNNTTNNNKVVPLNNGAPAIEQHRPMTRDERRIIFQKIDEVYVGEKVGYSRGWNDARIATDLGVPRKWVATIREENFGPEIDEDLAADAKALLIEIKKVGEVAEPIVRQLQALVKKAEAIERALQGLPS